MLGDQFAQAGVFEAKPFVTAVMKELQPLDLMDRVKMIARVLERFLPTDFEQAAVAIRSALPPPQDPGLKDDDFGSFIYAPLGVYVENHGLEGHLSTSLALLEDITQRFSMEFSIRAFLNRWPKETLAQMHLWTTHPHYHVRRLVSEGTRPRLPWGKAITIPDSARWPLLDALHSDPTRYVTRSVANHLNDLTKNHPEEVLQHLAKWKALGKQDPKEIDWIAKHALRGLIKAGHQGAMAHLGFDPDVAAKVTSMSLVPDNVTIGSSAEIALAVVAPKGASLMVDYVIDFVKSNGSSSPKVFKMKVLKGEGNVEIPIRKKHVFKKGATTFTLFPGQHQLHVQINGIRKASVPFTLSS